MDTFYHFESSIHFASFCFANFSMKTRSTEKMEYTTTKPTENPSKLSPHFFYFWNFVTEIFRHKVMLKIIISSIEKCTNFLINSWFLTLLCDLKSQWQSFKYKKKWDDSFEGFSVFLYLCHKDFSSQSNVKNHDLSKSRYDFLLFRNTL